MNSGKPFKTKPQPEDCGGDRAVESDWDCEEGCIPLASQFFWADGAVWFPDGTGEDEDADGICQLVSTENEIQLCRPDPDNPKPPEWPTPFPVCDYAVRPIQTIEVAIKAPTKEWRCNLGAFRPFHRLGTSSEGKCRSGQVFLGGSTAGGPTWPIYQDFVRNFDRKNMSMTGPTWLAIVDGCLVGESPIVEVGTPFDFVVTATNAKGSESVNLKIMVEP